MRACVCVCVCVCVAQPVAVELGCHATALIIETSTSFALYELYQDQLLMMYVSDFAISCDAFSLQHYGTFETISFEAILCNAMQQHHDM